MTVEGSSLAAVQDRLVTGGWWPSGAVDSSVRRSFRGSEATGIRIDAQRPLLPSDRIVRVLAPQTVTSALPANGVSPDVQACELLIVDDCTLYRENLGAAISATGWATTRFAWDLPTLYEVLTENPPNLVLINLDTRDSALLLQATLEISPAMGVVVFGVSEDDEAGIVACAEAGVAGYHLRSESMEELLTLIRRVADGESACSPRVSAILLRRLSALAAQRHVVTKELVLTTREVEVLRMLDMGLSNREIAARLCIAVHTVKNHVHSVLTKLGVGTRAEAAARFRAMRFTELES